MDVLTSSWQAYFATEIRLLTNLEKLEVSNNALQGTITSQIFQLPLFYLGLEDNEFLGTLASQKWVDCRIYNVLLSESVPLGIAMLNCLEYLILEINDFTGSFMSEMGLMALLNGINTGFNNMSSSLPNEFFN